MAYKLITSLVLLMSTVGIAQENDQKGPYGDSLIGGYAFGIEYAPSASVHFIQYETEKTGPVPGLCDDKESVRECYGVLSPRITNSMGIFLTKQYVPKGFFILDGGFNFSIHRYQAALNRSETSFSIEDEGLELTSNEIEEPLASLELDAYAFATRYSGKIGLAPPFLPDVILSSGPGVEALYGTLTVNGKSFSELIFSPHFFVQGELVWARFLGKGSISTYMDLQLNFSTNKGRVASIKTEEMSNFRMITTNMTLGLLRLVLPI